MIKDFKYTDQELELLNKQNERRIKSWERSFSRKGEDYRKNEFWIEEHGSDFRQKEYRIFDHNNILLNRYFSENWNEEYFGKCVSVYDGKQRRFTGGWNDDETTIHLTHNVWWGENHKTMKIDKKLQICKETFPIENDYGFEITHHYIKRVGVYLQVDHQIYLGENSIEDIYN